MIVDINTCFGTAVTKMPDRSLPTLLRELRRHEIALACTYSLRGVSYSERDGNREAAAAAKAHPNLLPIATLNPRKHVGLEKDVEDALQAGAVAFRFFPDEQGWTVDSLPFRRVLKHLAPHGLPLMVSLGQWSWGNASKIGQATADYGLPVILMDVHYSNLPDDILALQEFPHLLAETQRLATPGAVEIFVGEVGADRLLYGSGAPYRPIQSSLNMILAADISNEQKAAILSGNARRVLKLPSATMTAIPAPRYPDAPIIDVHTHIGQWATPLAAEDTPENLERLMAKVGIEKVVCSHAVAILWDMAEGNRALHDIMETHPAIHGYIVMNANQVAASRAQLAQYQADPHFVGVKVHAQLSQCPTGAPEMAELFTYIADWGRPTLIHNWGAHWPAAIRDIARRHPNLPIIVAHAFEHTLFPPHAVFEVIKDTPNLYIEFCHTFPERHALRLALNTVGPERILFGTDADLLAPEYILGTYWDAELTPKEMPLLMRENARRLFNFQ